LREEQEEIEHLSQSITRNSSGDAIINIYDRSGTLVDEVIVDDDKYHELKKYSWSQKSLYCQTRMSNKNVLMHRYLMKAEPDQIVDHINGNPNDNRLCNLRFASFSLNARNKEAKGLSKHLGVTLVKKRWIATIAKDRVTYNCGSYDTEDEAAVAVNLMAIRLYGNDAKLNIIPGDIYDKYVDHIKEKLKDKLA
jgi:hypothetical protein